MFSNTAVRKAEIWAVTGILLKSTLTSEGSRTAYLFQLSFGHQLVVGRLEALLLRPEHLVQVESRHFVQQCLNRFVREGGLGLGGLSLCGRGHTLLAAG